MRIVVIDDERQARQLLGRIIDSEVEDAEVHEAGDLEAGVDVIRKTAPDLVFLDIEMPGRQGTDILDLLGPSEIDFHIVFTTAYAEYAVKAFEMNAIDYLLKPLRPSRVRAVIDRVRELRTRSDLHARLDELRQSLRSGAFRKIGLPVSNGIRFVPVEDIVHLEADGMYTRVHTRDGAETVVSKPLKFFTHLLEQGGLFYRPHRSHIIHLGYLKQFVRKDGTYIVLENDQSVPIAKDRREEFLELVSAL